MKYRCVFPNCTYCTDDRSLIELHHINPKELGVKLNKAVTIPLCPTHHKLIFHPDAKTGQHAIQHPDSMIVVQVAKTTHGSSVIFRDMGGQEITVTIDHRPSIEIHMISWDIIHGLQYTPPKPDTEDYIGDIVDRNGYYAEGNCVYYLKQFEHVAKDMLAGFIAQYMIKAKQEYQSGLQRARQDYKTLKA